MSPVGKPHTSAPGTEDATLHPVFFPDVVPFRSVAAPYRRRAAALASANGEVTAFSRRLELVDAPETAGDVGSPYVSDGTRIFVRTKTIVPVPAAALGQALRRQFPRLVPVVRLVDDRDVRAATATFSLLVQLGFPSPSTGLYNGKGLGAQYADAMDNKVT